MVELKTVPEYHPVKIHFLQMYTFAAPVHDETLILFVMYFVYNSVYVYCIEV